MARGPDVHTLAGPYALNALPPRDRQRFERHLSACEACAAEVRGLQETAARLAAATAVAPAGRLRERVLAEVARTRQLPPVPDEAAGVSWRAGGWRRAGRLAPPALRRRVLATQLGWARPFVTALAAVFLVAAVVFGVMAMGTQHRLNQAQNREHMLAAVLTAPDAKMMSATVTGGGTATVVMSHRERALAFSSAGLPSLPAGKAYELWLMGPPGARSAAMLPRPAHGMTSPVIATGLRGGDTVELTVEPSGGAAHPTGRPILVLVL
ncbi:MAG TPA: anti-sigma factor [Streptosporangiaceae bacterium]|jgi:anti-sigma-K factor RskA